MGWLTSDVHVSLISVRTGKPVFRAKVPVDDLPDSFLADTTMYLGPRSWHVVRAEPPLKSAFAKTKKLTIYVERQSSTEQPPVLLFAVPTVSDAWPPEGNVACDGTETTLLDDDWRQVEFVSAAHVAAVDRELAGVRAVLQNEQEAPGFRSCHARTLVSEPLAGRVVSGSALTSHFGQLSRRIRVHEAQHRIADGFVVPIEGGSHLYGTYVQGSARVLGLLRGSSGAVVGESKMEKLRSLAREHELVLVDWCGCRRASAADSAFGAIVSGM